MWLFATCHWSQSGLSPNEKSEQNFISKGYFIIIIVILMKVHGLNNSFRQLQTHALSMGPTRFITIYNNEKKNPLFMNEMILSVSYSKQRIHLFDFLMFRTKTTLSYWNWSKNDLYLKPMKDCFWSIWQEDWENTYLLQDLEDTICACHHSGETKFISMILF